MNEQPTTLRDGDSITAAWLYSTMGPGANLSPTDRWILEGMAIGYAARLEKEVERLRAEVQRLREEK